MTIVLSISLDEIFLGSLSLVWAKTSHPHPTVLVLAETSGLTSP